MDFSSESPYARTKCPRRIPDGAGPRGTSRGCILDLKGGVGVLQSSCSAPPPASQLIAVTTEQLRSAEKEPARGRPAYSAMCPDGNPTEVIRDPVFNPNNFWNVAANDGWATGITMGPLTTAPMAAQAAAVDLGELRTLYETARLLRPRVGRGSQVWGLKNRAARDGEMPHNWGLDVRLGPNAPGVFSQVASDLNATPPGIRKVGSRRVMTVLRSHGLAGSPPSIATDVHLGSSVMAY